MEANFQRSLAAVLQYEGGYVNHPKDPGGATNRGVIQKNYDRFRRARNKPTQSVKLITDAEVVDYYRSWFWNALRGDSLPSGVDLAVFDFGVNSGPSRSAKYLQRIVGAGVDGQIGPETLKKTILAEAKSVIKKLCAMRLGFVQSLRIWETFGRGWSRRIAHVEATALSWVLTKAELEKEAERASGKSAGQSGGSVVVGTGGASSATQWGDWVYSSLAVAAFCLVAFMLIRAVINAQRAAALKAAAKEA